MIESDFNVAIASVALERSNRLSTAAVRSMLLSLRLAASKTISIDQVLELAGVNRPSVNMTVGDVERDFEKSLSMDIKAIPISSDRYPPSLRSISDAPPVIYVRGPLTAFQNLPGVAVVGTRKASPHGLTIAERIAEYLSNEGIPVVSGLALGIDAAAHEGALLGKSPTIAVLAHGLEKAQPVANRPLAQRILEGGGVWVSEHAFGVPAKPGNFVLRNRIQVGLACASIIVEGEEQSGSKTQADFCLRNKRTLFAVLPEAGSRVSTVSELPRMLVNVRGATPIFSRNDYPSMLTMIDRARNNLNMRETEPD